jgi:hypothetical protein
MKTTFHFIILCLSVILYSRFGEAAAPLVPRVNVTSGPAEGSGSVSRNKNANYTLDVTVTKTFTACFTTDVTEVFVATIAGEFLSQTIFINATESTSATPTRPTRTPATTTTQPTTTETTNEEENAGTTTITSTTTETIDETETTEIYIYILTLLQRGERTDAAFFPFLEPAAETVSLSPPLSAAAVCG